MLAWAGQSYAVANAHPAARLAAGEVLAESNDQDAVAVLIHRLMDQTGTSPSDHSGDDTPVR
jgi:hydroxymethylpyrimidine pyrophosphatase-like HAD family hydrolase